MTGEFLPAVDSIAWNEMRDALIAERALVSEPQQKLIAQEKRALHYRDKWKTLRAKVRRLTNALADVKVA